MLTNLLAFLTALAVAVALTPVVRHLAHRFGAIDHALSSRKVHKKPIPRLGGIAIVAGFYAPVVVLWFVSRTTFRSFFLEHTFSLALFGGGLVIAALGIYDDLKGASPRLKLAVQIAVALVAYLAGYQVRQIFNPFGPAIPLGDFSLPFTVFWVVGIINAINLIDGLDGLAGGVTFISVVTTFVAASLHGFPVTAFACAALGGAVLGFLVYNFNPASIFMGDTGSMFLGFVLATSSLRGNLKANTAVAILVPIVALGLPIADTLLAMARRALRGLPVFRADREHIHHKLLAMGFSHRRVVITLYGASVVLAGFALALSSAQGRAAALLLFGVALAGGLLLRRMGYIRVEHAGHALRRRRRNLELRRSIQQIGEDLRRASQVEDVWGAVRSAMPAVGAECARLQLVIDRPDGKESLQLTEGFDEAGGDLFRSRHCLMSERPDAGMLELGWTDGRSAVSRDTEIAIEQLCEYVLQAVSRIEVEPVSLEAARRRRAAAPASAPAQHERQAPGRVASLRH